MLTITPIRTPERASDHLARVHRYGAEEPPVTAWFGAGAVAKGLSGPVDGAHPQAFVARTRQAGQRTLTHSPSIDGSTVNDPSAPPSSTRVEGL